MDIKRKMKTGIWRSILFTLVLCLLLPFSGCGNSKENSTPETASKSIPAKTSSFPAGSPATVGSPATDSSLVTDDSQAVSSEKSASSDHMKSSSSSSGGEDDPLHISFGTPGDGGVTAVWWWNAGVLKYSGKVKAYLDFLESNRVNRIYLCYPDFPEKELTAFVRLASARGIGVSLLSGDASWIQPENKGADAVYEKFLNYQKNAPEDGRLVSLHMDVEPHQRQDFATDRQRVLQMYADFVVESYEKIHQAGEKLEWDIPFWFDDMYVNDAEGQPVELLKLLSCHADTLCLMSYRDTAWEVLAVSEKEIQFCLENGCTVICGVEAFSEEGDAVSFMEEGKAEMYKQLGVLYENLSRRMGGRNYGVAIHYLTTWMDMKD